MSDTADSAGRQKLDQVILFLVSRAPAGRLSITKLWKLLYYVELTHVQQFGRAVSGIRLLKGRYGPIPADGMALIEELTRANVLAAQRISRFRGWEWVCRALAPPNLTGFEFSERAILEEVALDWMRATTRQLAAAIHESMPWKSVPYGEELPVSGGSSAV